MDLSLWMSSLMALLTPEVIAFNLFGVVVGLIIGALPGLSATMAIAILTPITFWFEPQCGFAMLIGVWNAAIFAGGISAILINTPGTPASIVSTFDGYRMFKQGKGGLALGLNVLYSAFGGILSTIFLIFLSFQIAKFTVTFGPTEYFMLAFFGLIMMISVSENNVIKGMAMGFLGLTISCVGIDPILASKRFTMDTTALVAGVSFLPAMIGMFGIGEILNQIFEFSKKKEAEANAQIELVKKGGNLGRVLPTWAQVKQFFRPTLIAGTESTIIGAIPAAGGDIASIICWGQAKRMSKHPEEYGNGSPEGFAVSCTANNGVLGGALTTMLTLGIPGDAVTAILIGSLMMYGMQPGPKMFTEHADFVMQIMQLMLLSNLVFVVIGLLSAKLSARILNAKPQTIWVSVIALCVVGSYALNNSFTDVLIMAFFGIAGFFFKRGKYPAGPFILGLLLGGMLESNLRRALVMSHGSLMIFLERPVTLVLCVMILLTLFYPLLKKKLKGKRFY
ncbi:MAG: tripartite tricarboxylate transporter permease [Succinivibrio dextrinosolvens]|nr:tripartite tricarboxylate transporter permease [Succinivibrio dextrinosolvens]